MRIRDGRIEGGRWIAANAAGGEIRPQLIVLHDTAGRLAQFNSVHWFARRDCKTSAHVVVERDGTITQMVRFDRKANHAGHSIWRGRRQCNSFSIGIEIVNPGECDANGRAWFHKDSAGRPREPGFPLDQLMHHPSPTTHGTGPARWMPYTGAQIDAVNQLCRALVDAYPDVNEIVTHWMISPGRKFDTNPLFPLDEVRAFALDDGADDADTASSGAGIPAWQTSVLQPPTSSVSGLLPHSRHVQVGEATDKTGQAVVALSIGGAILSFMRQTQEIIHGFGELLGDKVFLVAFAALALGGVVLVVVGQLIKRLTVTAHKQGRYVASGQVGEG